MEIIDWFAGIGGFRRGMELAGHECVGFCEFDKFATASYTSMHLITDEQREYLATLSLKQRQKEILKEEYRNGEWYANDIRAVCARDIPRADCWCFGAPCFLPGTLITTHRGLVPIEEIQTNDYVLTHRNRFQKVTKPMVNVKRGIYTLKVQGSPETKVTGNHRFFVRDKKRIWNNDLRRYEIAVSEPYWKEVEKFDGNELIQFPVNPNSVNCYDLTQEECWLLGRYVADGYIRNGERKDRPSNNEKVIFCIGKEKEEDFNNHVKSVEMYVSEERTVNKHITGNKKLFSLCSKCGKGAENKMIPQFIMDLPKDMLKSFIDGYLCGDGSFADGVWKASSISKKLIYQLGQCILKVYCVGYSIFYCERPKQYIIEGRTVNQHDTWQINFRLNSKNHLWKYTDGSLWMPVREIEYNPKQKSIVYNMEVENDNSYTANNMGVHNCQDFSVAGKRAGLDGDRSSLIREIFRLLEEQEEQGRPEWLIYENVKGMLSSNRGLDYLSILSEMDRLGYDCEWQNINSSWFVPQNRERIYTIGHLRRFGQRKILPIERADGENSVSIMGHRKGFNRNLQTFSPNGITEALSTCRGGGREHHVGIKVIGTTNPNRHSSNDILDTDGITGALTSHDKHEPKQVGIKIKDDFLLSGNNYNQCKVVHGNGSISRTLIGSGHAGNEPKVAIPIIDVGRISKGQNGKRMKENGEPMFTLTAQDRHGVGVGTQETIPKQGDGIYVQMSEGFIVYAVWYEKEQCYITVRKLTPKECFRLQGWTDDYFERAAFVNSDSQLYKQAGNGVTVNVVYEIGKRIKESGTH